MTAQMPESLLFEGEVHALCDLPLEAYFELGGERPDLDSPTSACWRGYVGSWEVRERRLYLVGLTRWLNGGVRIKGIDGLFPGFPDRVFAHWCNDRLRVPQGRCLKYVHAGFGSEYERDLLLHFRRGILEDVTVRTNGTAGPDAPEGYAVAGFAAFSSGGR